MAKKRGNGEGSITRRKDGRWSAVITTGYDPETGKQKRKTFYGKTRQEVSGKMAQALHQLSSGIILNESKITLGEWLDIWLKEYAKPNIRPSTWKSYEMLVRLYIKPACGNIKLKQLQPHHLQTLYNSLSSSGRVKGEGGLSPRTVCLVNVVLHQALNQAIDEDLIIRNVTAATKLPKQQKKEMRALTSQEQAELVKHLDEDRLGCALLMLLGSGLRCGELLGLRWQDVDLKKGIIRVNRCLSRIYTDQDEKKTALVFHDLKTKTSQRSIPLPASIIIELKKHRARQNEEKLQAGKGYEDQDLVFCTEIGRPIDPRNLAKRLERITEKAGIEKINLHGLRHTYATRLLEMNENPRVVQELLGHSQISLTLGLYSHVFPETKQKAADKLETFFKDVQNPSKKEGSI